MKAFLVVSGLALLGVMPCLADPPARPDPRQRAYALIDEQQAEAALAGQDLLLLEDALVAAQAKLEALSPPTVETPASDLSIHLAWQLFWYRLRALGSGGGTNLYARELAQLACFPASARLAAVRLSFQRLFRARDLMAAHPQLSRIAHAQQADFASAIEAYAPRFAMATSRVAMCLASGRPEPVVDPTSVHTDRWADAEWQRAREALHTGPAAVFATIEQHDAARDDADLVRAGTVGTRDQAVYWLNRVKVRLLVLQEAVNLLESEPRLCRIVAWHEARGALYRDPRAGGLVAEMELYATVAPALARLRGGPLQDLRELCARIAAAEKRLETLPPDLTPDDPPAALFALDHPAGFVH